MTKSNRTIKFLETERLYLRPVEEEDLDFIYTHALWDKEGRRLTGTQSVFSRKVVYDWFERVSTDSSRIDLLICMQDTDQVIGDISMLEIDHQNRNAEMRVSIFDQAFWGNGYGTEAMALFVNYGFKMLNLHRISLDVFAYNERAIKSYQKLGFVQEGIKRDQLFYDGEYHDSIMMSVLADEFIK
ncbi:GNAT family protein [Pseudalkalibacillus sp. SCS-8]|uniref:GNAT family N-acetyltransferase n=1 Tax=Pseudalkalibacillus nanhaiensis TaxID=3115291 RepID=UPI0032DADF57